MTDLQEDSKSCYKAVVREAIRYSTNLSSNCFLPLEQLENNLFSMKSSLASHGIVSKAVEIKDLDSLPEEVSFIAQVKRGFTTHFILLKKRRKNGFHIYDPAHGNFWLQKENIEEDMTNKGLLIYRGKKEREREKFPKVISFEFGLILALLMVIRTLCGGVFLYALNQIIPTFWAYITLVLFVLSSFLTYLTNNRMIRKYNFGVTLPLLSKVKAQETFEKSTKIMTEKLNFFNGILNKVSFFIISVILFLNIDLWLFLILLICLTCGGIGILASRIYFQKRKARLSYDEEKTMLSKMTPSRFSKLWSDANSLSLIMLLPNLFILTLTIGLLVFYFGHIGNLTFSGILPNLFLVSGTIFYLLKAFDEYEKVTKIRALVYSLGKPYYTLLKKEKERCYTFEAKKSQNGNEI